MALIIGLCSAKEIAIMEQMGCEMEVAPLAVIPVEDGFDTEGRSRDPDSDLRYVQIWIDCGPLDLLDRTAAREAAKVLGYSDLNP